MKYHLVNDRKKLKEAPLTLLDKAILEKCKLGSMNITRLIKAAKPYYIGSGRAFASTQEVVSSVEKLQRLGLLERR